MANRFCSLHQSSNAGFGPLATDPKTCITISCPNSTTTPMDEYFQQSQWGSNINNSCMKPLADAQVSKQYRCDERWYDWFTIPNYHLGNGYMNPDPENPGVCYTPCSAGSLPAYLTDPIDGQTLHFTNNDDDNGNCISRANYFGGKYAEGSDYCPLSWIYILNSSPKSLKDMVNTHNDTFAKSDMASNVLTKAFSDNQKNSAVYANNIYNLLPTELNNISTPSANMQNACNRIETPQRVLPAYTMCSNLMINETKVYDTFAQTLPPNYAKDKVTMMKQACNAVFCNLHDPAHELIKKQPLCFQNVGKFDPSTGETINNNTLERVAPPEPIPQKTYMMRSIKIAVYLALFPLLAYILYILFTDLLYPYVLLPIWVKLGILFKFLPPDYGEIILVERLTKKLERAEMQCESDKNQLNADNEILKKLGKPLNNPPNGGFKNCNTADRLRAELDNTSFSSSNTSESANGLSSPSGLGGPNRKSLGKITESLSSALKSKGPKGKGAAKGLAVLSKAMSGKNMPKIPFKFGK